MIEKPESALETSGLAARVVKPWETVEIGPFSFTALAAVAAQLLGARTVVPIHYGPI